MKRIIPLVFLFFIATSLSAQQEAQYTQFMHFKLAYNPAYAGAENGPSLSGLVRSQWLGFEGAPQTQGLSFNMPLVNNRVGVGANVVRHTVGLSEDYTIDGVYAYRFEVPRGYLSLGLQASVRFLQVDFSAARATQSVDLDNAIPQGVQGKTVPNFGAGIYYNSRNFYLGFSIPRLLTNNIDLADDESIVSREVSHAYLMSGVNIPLGESLSLQPQFLLNYVQDAPFDAQAGLSLQFLERFTGGVSLRLGGSEERGFGESASLLFSALISDNFLMGLSYDLTLSEIRDYSSGSLEVALRYFFSGKEKSEETDIVDPRTFF